MNSYDPSDIGAIGDAVLAAEIIPAAREAIGGVGAGQRAQRHEDDTGGMPSEQQEAAEQQREGEADDRAGGEHQEDVGDVEVAREQRDAIAGRAEEQGLA